MIDVLSLIEHGETQLIEFKSSCGKEVVETVVAFANAKGGTIFVGVNDAGKSVGLDMKNETIQNYINQIKQNTQPSIVVSIDNEIVDTKTILIIDVKEQPTKPISYKNRYFKRVQNSNHLMNLEEISNEHLKSINESWDYYVDDRHSLDDISIDNILNYIKKIEDYQDKQFSDDFMSILRKYELIKDGKLTYAAYLLFTGNNSILTAFQIGRFKSETKIIDNIDINIDLLSQIEEAINFIKKHLMIEYIFTGEAQRIEKYDYPLEAIREIVVNMVVHRDYRDNGHSIIKIFDDRMEFFNPGKLYDDLTIEKLNSNDYSSRTRNRAIARAFKEIGVIEQYGSGIKRVKDECLKHGVIEPTIEEFQHGFRVVLYKKKLDRDDEGVSEGVSEGVNNLHTLIKKHSNKKTPFFAQKLNTSVKNIERWIKQLKNENKIEFRGAPKTGGYWSLDD